MGGRGHEGHFVIQYSKEGEFEKRNVHDSHFSQMCVSWQHSGMMDII